jgi:hypothetical protein
VGCLGYNDIGPIEIAPDINIEKWEIKNDICYMRSQGCQLVITFFHWGIENSYSITARQQDLGHFTIGNGADLVLGAHPHCNGYCGSMLLEFFSEVIFRSRTYPASMGGALTGHRYGQQQ